MLSGPRLVILALLSAVLLGVFVTPVVRHVLVVGSGYVAKSACSAHLLADRPLAQLRTPGAELASPFLLHRLLDSLLSFEVLSYGELSGGLLQGEEEELAELAIAVRCSSLLDAERVALFRPALGCTLLPDLAAATALLDATLRDRYVEYASALRDRRQLDSEESLAQVWPDTNRVRPQAQLSSSQWNAPSGSLAFAVQAAFAEHYGGADNPKLTRSLVVVQHGEVVASRAAPGFSNARTPQLGWSMTKSVLSALVGIRIGQGHLSLDSPANAAEWPEQDPRHNITVRHLIQ
jgi:Beta-lactamase